VDWLNPFDERILAWFRGFWGTRHLDGVMLDATALGGTYVLVGVLLFSVGLLFVLGRRRTALFVLVVVLGGELVVAGIKQTIHRERPSTRHELVAFAPTSWSFPSGHSMGSAITYLTLAFVAATPLTRRRGRIYLVSCALFLVFLIGVSRAYLNVHYPTDVIGGWTIGLVWALGCRWVEDRWGPLRQEELEPPKKA
jgi:undecaprenyl-diphosphatase